MWFGVIRSAGIVDHSQHRRILANHYNYMLQTPGEHPVFQDDNAPVHMSRFLQIWLHKYEEEHLT